MVSLTRAPTLTVSCSSLGRHTRGVKAAASSLSSLVQSTGASTCSCTALRVTTGIVTCFSCSVQRELPLRGLRGVDFDFFFRETSD